jgi:hypothetical protein
LIVDHSIKMLKPGVYTILDPGHTEIKNIEDLSTRVEDTGKPLFFTLKGEYTMYIFQTRFGSGTFDTNVDGVSVGKTDSDRGTLLVVPVSFILKECDAYTKWFIASCRGKFCTFFKIDEDEEISSSNGVLSVGTFLTLDTSQGYERNLEIDLDEGQRISRTLTCFDIMQLKFMSLKK